MHECAQPHSQHQHAPSHSAGQHTAAATLVLLYKMIAPAPTGHNTSYHCSIHLIQVLQLINKIEDQCEDGMSAVFQDGNTTKIFQKK
jgi:hypothetical protein